MRRRTEDAGAESESAYSWLVVVGVDIPYPPRVAEALERVEAETARRRQLECDHRQTRQRFAERNQNLGLHAYKGRERYCVDCGQVFEFKREIDPPRRSATRRYEASNPGGIIPVLLDAEAAAAQLMHEVERLRPRQAGLMRETVLVDFDAERRRRQRQARGW